VEPWQKLGERVAYDGFRRVLSRRFRLPTAETFDFEVKDERDVVTVLPLTRDEQVVLVRQFRVGPEEVLLELPGGALSPGEPPDEGAHRELLEETGYEGQLRPVGAVLHCAYSTRSSYVFVARGCEQVASPQPSSGEVVEVTLLALPAFRDHLRSGRLTDVAAGYLGLDALNLL
jgi:ADP-ribose pyrophosphatase